VVDVEKAAVPTEPVRPVTGFKVSQNHTSC
jgi:hypothetical protein